MSAEMYKMCIIRKQKNVNLKAHTPIFFSISTLDNTFKTEIFVKQQN
jgi:hypothetical protein